MRINAIIDDPHILCAEYVNLYQHRYRCIFDITSKKQIKDLHLTYLGNFSKLDIPKDERYATYNVVLDSIRPKELYTYVCDLYQKGFHRIPERKHWNSALT